jgi:hypothetical protein
MLPLIWESQESDARRVGIRGQTWTSNKHCDGSGRGSRHRTDARQNPRLRNPDAAVGPLCAAWPPLTRAPWAIKIAARVGTARAAMQRG